MKKLKSEKGITLTTLTITVIVLLIISSIVVSYSTRQLTIKKVNNLYSDIEAINTKISDYYLTNNSLPIFESNPYLSSSSVLESLLVLNGGSGNLINANDSGKYYVIDLSKLENLTLNYGRDYQYWTDDSTYEDYQDLYIINTVTHQIYYPQGVKHSGKMYFSYNIDNDEVTEITTDTITDGISIESISASKTVVSDDYQIVTANVVLSISEDFDKSTLQYGWKLADSTEDVTYTGFSVDDSSSATLTSKQIAISTQYVLYIKILDNNGDEHIIEQDVTIEDKVETISTTESFVGCYADLDGDGEPEGVIYADLCIGGEGTWNFDSCSTYSYNAITGTKDYYENGTYDGDFGEKEVISLVSGSTGEERFYVMALSDVAYCCWYYSATLIESNSVSYDTNDFGEGYTNTTRMIEAWNEGKYGTQNGGSYEDMWGLSAVQDGYNEGWFVPSKSEWAAFAVAFELPYGSAKGLYDFYWTSSQASLNRAWIVNEVDGYIWWADMTSRHCRGTIKYNFLILHLYTKSFSTQCDATV